MSILLKQLLKVVQDVAFEIHFSKDDVLTVGCGEPIFSVKINKPISQQAFTTGTSLALGEAYMNSDIEVEGDLFAALNAVMSQTHKFSLDMTALRTLLHTSVKAKNQEKEVRSHYDIGNDFYKAVVA